MAGTSGACAAAFAYAELLDLSLVGRAVAPHEAVLAVALAAAFGGGLGLALRAFITLVTRGRLAASGNTLIALAAGLAGALSVVAVGYAFARDLPPEERLGGILRFTATFSPVLGILTFSSVASWLRNRHIELRKAGALCWGFALLMAAAGFARIASPRWWLACSLLGALPLLLTCLRFPRASIALNVVALSVALAGTWPRVVPSNSAAAPVRAVPGSAVVIVLDTVRADALGAYGAAGNPTPAFDALATQGVLYEQAIAPASWTLPVHVSLFTGLVPRTHGVGQHSMRRLGDEVTTLAEELQNRGFETAAFSGNSWLRVGNLFQGFERRMSTHFLPRDRLGLAALMRYSGCGFDRWIDKGGSETLEGLAAWLGERDPARPFFLFVNLYEAHDPYLPPARHRRGSLRDRVDALRSVRRFDAIQWHKAGPRPPAEIRALRSLYDGAVRFQDEQLGALFELLRSRVDLRTAAVFITSDHGENFGEGERWQHTLDVNDTLIRVPLVLVAPGHQIAGARNAEQHNLLDVNQTLRAWTGLSPSGEGHDLLARSPQSWPLVVSEYVPNSAAMAAARGRRTSKPEAVDWPARTVRSGDWKLTTWGSGSLELFDLVRDPLELRDVSAENPERVAALRAALDAWLSAYPERLPADPRTRRGAELDDDVREQLRALGYL